MNKKELCPRFEKAMSIMSQRWTGLVIYQLLNGPQRFSELESSIGISGKVLSDRLKDLESQEITQRLVYAETPVRIEYSLTEKGKALEPVLRSIEQWSQTWISKED